MDSHPAGGSVLIPLLLVAGLVAIMSGFASCTESQSYLAGLALMAFYFLLYPVRPSALPWL